MVRLLVFLFLSQATTAFGQSDDNSYAGRRIGSDSLKIEEYLRLADHHKLTTANYDSAIFYSDNAISLSRTLKLEGATCRALESKGNSMARMREFKEAISVLEEAVSICGSSNQLQTLANCYNALGYIYDRQDVHEKAIEYFLKSASLNEQMGSTDRLANAYMNVVSIFGQQERVDKVKEYTKKALDLVPKVADEATKANIYFASASQYTELGSKEPAYLDSALAIVESGLGLAYRHNFKVQLAKLFSVKSAIYFLRQDFRNCIRFSDSVMNYRDFATIETLILANIRYSNGYAGLGQAAKSFRYLDSAAVLNREINSTYYQMIIAESRYTAFKKTGQSEKALAALEELRGLEDDLFVIEKEEVIYELEQQYETEKKELQIVNLTQENEIQRLQGKQRLFYLTAGMLLLLLLTLTIYFYLKQRLNKQKEQTAIHRQQLLRSQINPHFIFNALSSIRGFLFDEKNVKEAIGYLGKFARLMRTVLEHSSKEWVTLEEELAALRLYLEIQQLRFGQKFEFELDIDPELDTNEIYVPPLLAQPFIENSIEHGFKNVEKGGRVQIKCESNGDKLIFRIQDNGIGIEHFKLEKDHESRALAIFKDRLELLSKKLSRKLDFTIEDLGKSGTGSGTLVAYQLPLLKNNI